MTVYCFFFFVNFCIAFKRLVDATDLSPDATHFGGCLLAGWMFEWLSKHSSSSFGVAKGSGSLSRCVGRALVSGALCHVVLIDSVSAVRFTMEFTKSLLWRLQGSN